MNKPNKVISWYGWLPDLPEKLPDIGAAFDTAFSPDVFDGSKLKALDGLTATNTLLSSTWRCQARA